MNPNSPWSINPMKANIELSLRTREVYQLFERKINGDRLFIQAILHKFNIIINRCNKQEPHALVSYQQIEQQMQDLTKQFTSENKKFELLLAKRKDFDSKRVHFVVQFFPTVIVTNSLAMQLVELIEFYDKLVATLKLLHLSECFGTDEIYFENIKRIQKLTNRILSEILLKSTVSIARPSQLNELQFAI